MTKSILIVSFILSFFTVLPGIASSQSLLHQEPDVLDTAAPTLADLETVLRLMALVPPSGTGQRGTGGSDDPTVTVDGPNTTVTFKKDGKTYIIRHNSETGKTTIKIKKNRFVTFTYTIQCDSENNCTLKDFFGNTVCSFQRGSDGAEGGAFGSCNYLGSEFEFVIYINFEQNQVCVVTELGEAECIELTDMFEGEDLEKVIEMLRNMFPEVDEEPGPALKESLSHSQVLR